jgi:anthranilate/para-aminobenzoate synthase component II
MGKILVTNFSKVYGEAVEGLGEVTTNLADFISNPEEYTLVLFTGGEDVSPDLYGDISPKDYCWYDKNRDKQEISILNIALKYDIPVTGICRGSQFLNVMTGGKMIHHLEGHGGTLHNMTLRTNEVFRVNSTHHQMCLPGKNTILIGWSTERMSDIYIGDLDEEIEYTGPETEAFIFPNIHGFAVQYHPETMGKNTEGYLYYWKTVKDLIELPMEKLIEKNKGKEHDGMSSRNKGLST